MAKQLIDQFDQDNNLIGPIGRKEAHERGLWHRAVSVWLYTPSGKILLQRRPKTVSEAPGKLDISVAGHVEAGDTVEHTAVKELVEEVGVHINADQLGEPVIYKYDYPSQTTGNQHRRFAYIYFVQIPDDTPITFNDGEVDEVKWVTLAEFERVINDDDFRDHSDEYLSITFTYLKSRIDA